MKIVHCFFLAASAALLLLAGCTREMHIAAVSDSGNVPMREGSEAGLTYEYEIQYITGGVSSEVMEKINNYIIRKNISYDDEATGSDVPAACQRWTDDIIEGYRADTKDVEGDSWMFNWETSIKGQFTTACKARKLQSYRQDDYQYMGGAHGNEATTYTVFDMTTGEPVTEKAFLADGCEAELAEVLYERALESLEEADEDELFGSPSVNGNFSVDEDGVTWHYNPYEIAPYAMGTIDVFLSWNELKPFLR